MDYAAGCFDMHLCKDPIRCLRFQLYKTRFYGFEDIAGILLDLCGSFGIIVDSGCVVQIGLYLFICEQFSKDAGKILQDFQAYCILVKQSHSGDHAGIFGIFGRSEWVA
jgi:hypothetical protein